MTDPNTPASQNDAEPQRHIVDWKNLPAGYPTHLHSPDFWEALGRTVATFGFLENVLGRAIFAITGTTELPEDPAVAEVVMKDWPRTLERALFYPLGNLIDLFGKVVRENAKTTITNLDVLIEELRGAADLRNVLCHGFWGMPDAAGRSVPFFVNRKVEIFEAPVDIAFLDQTRAATLEMACGVINVVTHMGWQFPGSSGPGKPIWPE